MWHSDPVYLVHYAGLCVSAPAEYLNVLCYYTFVQTKQKTRYKCILPLLNYISRHIDGPYSFYPYFLNILSSQKFFSLENNIIVENTLLLDFKTPEVYDKAIPLFSGTYEQLVLHGTFEWKHVEQLMHPGVKQLRLNGYLKVTDAECDDTALFILNRARDPEFSFLVDDINYIGYKLTTRLAAAFTNHSTHSMKEKHETTYNDTSQGFTICNEVILRNRHLFWKMMDLMINTGAPASGTGGGFARVSRNRRRCCALAVVKPTPSALASVL
uniref:FBD domain-containing protein n=1 Tax=Panagrellus redivivus TaxID=6233 RepID=A0A7E4UPV7_PANRE